jgi:hypothetical protein
MFVLRKRNWATWEDYTQLWPCLWLAMYWFACLNLNFSLAGTCGSYCLLSRRMWIACLQWGDTSNCFIWIFQRLSRKIRRNKLEKVDRKPALPVLLMRSVYFRGECWSIQSGLWSLYLPRRLHRLSTKPNLRKLFQSWELCMSIHWLSWLR